MVHGSSTRRETLTPHTHQTHPITQYIRTARSAPPCFAQEATAQDLQILRETALPIHTRGLCTHNSFLSSLASSRRGHLSRQSQTLWWSGSNGTPSSWALSSATSERCHTCFTALVRQAATSRALNGLQWYTSAPACQHFNLAHSSLCSCR
jgi:hypothetical protein